LLSLALSNAEALGNSVVAAEFKLDRGDLSSQATQHSLEWRCCFWSPAAMPLPLFSTQSSSIFSKRSDATMSSEFRFRRISLDTWAVLLSLLAALLVRLGVLKVVPW
jgi:hypothetical protein